MHELGITSQLLAAVEERAQELGARKVVAINLVVGERSGVVDESLRFCFEMLAPGTLASDAEIVISRVPLRFGCPACRCDYTPAAADFACPRCGAVGKVIDAGNQLVIDSIEIET